MNNHPYQGMAFFLMWIFIHHGRYVGAWQTRRFWFILNKSLFVTNKLI